VIGGRLDQAENWTGKQGILLHSSDNIYRCGKRIRSHRIRHSDGAIQDRPSSLSLPRVGRPASSHPAMW